jgi:hypothetical protein
MTPNPPNGRTAAAEAMLLRMRLVLGSLISGGLLLLILCLGAQNLEDRPRLNLGIGRTAPLPTGFVVGIALVLGVISGGSAVALIPLPGAPGAEKGDREPWDDLS